MWAQWLTYGVVGQLDVVGRLASCRSRIALESDPMLEAKVASA
jgi:hypothetical protein